MMKKAIFFLTVLVFSGPLYAGCKKCGSANEAQKNAGATGKRSLASALAGSWYDGDKDRLSSEIDGYLKNVKQKPLADVQALILPHAGYRFSGQVAAFGVEQVAGKKYSRVIVLGPSHGLMLPNQASLPTFTHYSTPLGEIEIDLETVESLKKFPQFVSYQGAEEGEHSVQIEIPLLQKGLGPFKLVPIVVGQLDLAGAKAIGDALLSVIDERTLVVASSDFTHYGDNFDFRPFTKEIPKNLEKLDLGAFEKISAKDPAGFRGYVAKTGATICGRHPIEILLSILPAESKAHLLKYDTSGRMTGSYSSSVSYVTVAFTGKWPKQEGAELSPSDKKELLKLARKTLAYYMEKKKEPKPEELGVAMTAGMKKVMGAFVTLKKNGELRGCIGTILPRQELFKEVIAQAIHAAVHDSRFPPVTKGEVTALEVEISALLPPRTVDSYREIIIGKHGVILEKGGSGAVFLPQVAPEQGWDLETMLTHLSLKAGLAPDAWKEGARIQVFEAIVFSEHAA